MNLNHVVKAFHHLLDWEDSQLHDNAWTCGAIPTGLGRASLLLTILEDHSSLGVQIIAGQIGRRSDRDSHNLEFPTRTKIVT